MDEWQQAFGKQELVIPPRDLILTRDLTGPQALGEIAAWVREQGVAIGDNLVDNVSRELHYLWENIPSEKTCIVFRPNGFMKWPLFQYQ